MAKSKESMKTISIGISEEEIPWTVKKGCILIAKLAKRSAETFKTIAAENLEAAEAYATLALLEMMAEDEPELSMETLKGIFVIAEEYEAVDWIQTAMECDHEKFYQMFMECFLGSIKLREIYGTQMLDPQMDPAWLM